MDTRLHKEKEFHNKTFSDATRQKLGKFYSIAQISSNYYKQVLFSECSDKKVLELGCGPGNYSFQLVQNGAFVTGIDISEVAIEKAKMRFNNEYKEKVNFQVMNAEALDFENDTFDILCGISILHHLHLPSVYPEIIRVLKPNGKAIFIEPLGHNPFINFFRFITPQLRTEDEHPLLMTDLDLAKSFFSAFELNFFHFLTFFAVPFHKTKLFLKILNFLSKCDQWMFRKIPFLQKYSWIVVGIFTK